MKTQAGTSPQEMLPAPFDRLFLKSNALFALQAPSLVPQVFENE